MKRTLAYKRIALKEKCYELENIKNQTRIIIAGFNQAIMVKSKELYL